MRRTGTTRLSGLGITLMVTVGLALAGCTADDPGPGPGPTTGGPTASGSSSGASVSAGQWSVRPVWEGSVWLPSAGDLSLRMRLYPLQRVDGRVLMTVDVSPEGPAGAQTSANNVFCYVSVCRYMDSTALVDTSSLVRHAPLGVPVGSSDAGSASASGNGPGVDAVDDIYSSWDNSGRQEAGTTYRYGVFFSDPGTASTTVDLVHAGAIVGVPIVDDPVVAPGLVVGGVGVGDHPAPVEGVTSDGGPLVTYPVPRPAAAAIVQDHDLVAPVVGGEVTDYTGAVNLNADVLFAFNSASLSAKAKALIAQAARTVQAKADPGKPLIVTGHTDNVGGTAYNQRLSTQRAQAVADALKAGSVAAEWSVEVVGKGESEPVVPNTTPDGKDDPAGRALNRRVTIAYTPKPEPSPTPSTTTTTATGTGAGTGTGSGGAVVASVVSPSPVATLGPEPMVLDKRYAGADAGTAVGVVDEVQVTGALALVRFTVTAQSDVSVVNVFSTSKGGQDIGRVHLVDPGTKTAYLPAYDRPADPAEAGNLRFLGRWGANLMQAGRSYTYWVLTAAPPAGVSTVTAYLGPFETVDVPVRR